MISITYGRLWKLGTVHLHPPCSCGHGNGRSRRSKHCGHWNPPARCWEQPKLENQRTAFGEIRGLDWGCGKPNNKPIIWGWFIALAPIIWWWWLGDALWQWVYHITIHGNMFGILYMHMELWYHNWTYHFDMNGGFISSWEWTMKWPSSFWMPKKLMSSPLTMEHLIITKPWVIFFNVHVGWKTNIFFEDGFKIWLPVVTSFLVAVLSLPIFTGAFWFGRGILVVKGCEMGQDWGTPPSVFSIGNRVLDVGWPPRGLASSSGVWIYMEEARDIMDSFFFFLNQTIFGLEL